MTEASRHPLHVQVACVAWLLLVLARVPFFLFPIRFLCWPSKNQISPRFVVLQILFLLTLLQIFLFIIIYEINDFFFNFIPNKIFYLSDLVLILFITICFYFIWFFFTIPSILGFFFPIKSNIFIFIIINAIFLPCKIFLN